MARKLKTKSKPKPQANSVSARFAKVLNLSAQYEILYKQPNFYNSDLSWDALERLAKQNGATTSRKMRELKSQQALSGPEGEQLAALLKRLASDPALAKSFRKQLVEQLLDRDQRAPEEKDASEIQEEKDDAEFDAILIAARNQVVLADVKRLLTRAKKPVRSIALLYGAGHMQDLDAHLESDLGYRGRGADWLTAITTVP